MVYNWHSKMCGHFDNLHYFLCYIVTLGIYTHSCYNVFYVLVCALRTEFDVILYVFCSFVARQRFIVTAAENLNICTFLVVVCIFSVWH